MGNNDSTGSTQILLSKRSSKSSLWHNYRYFIYLLLYIFYQSKQPGEETNLGIGRVAYFFLFPQTKKAALRGCL